MSNVWHKMHTSLTRFFERWSRASIYQKLEYVAAGLVALIVLNIIFSISGGSSDPEPVAQSAASNGDRVISYSDDRYIEAANRNRYYGKEAEDVAEAAKSICLASGADDC